MDFLTDAIYRASKPDAFQSLYSISAGGQGDRRSAAIALQNQGYKINVPMDIWGWDAGKFMSLAQGLGLKTVPALFETLPGTIKVSIDAADYPPAHPVTPPTPGTISPIGAQSTTPGTYGVTPAAFHIGGVPLYVEGEPEIAPDGQTVHFHAFMAPPFDMPAWEWETAAAKAKRLAAEATAL